MKTFPTLKEYSDDELIIIIYDQKELWQKEAIEFAKYLLQTRGISDDYAKARIIQIRDESEILWQKELELRKVESYNIFEIFYYTLFWPKFLFRNWHLKQDGYIRKQKQRLYTIAFGIVLWLMLFFTVIPSFDYTEQGRINQIMHNAQMDSIALSKIDWSGEYIFTDTLRGQKSKIVWDLNIQKESIDHKGTLKLISYKKSITISCIGLIKKDDFEIYPDTTYTLFNGMTISYYDKLFTFVKSNDEIITFWGKMKPFYFPNLNDVRLFIKK
jgi:hypothetical protein